MFFFDLENYDQISSAINMDSYMKTYFSRKQDKDKKDDILKIRREMKDSNRRLKWMEQLKTSFVFLGKSFETLTFKADDETFQKESEKLYFLIEVLEQSILFPSIHKIKKATRSTQIDYLNSIIAILEKMIDKIGFVLLHFFS